MALGVAEGQIGLAMCSSGPQGQTEPALLAKGRANSELRNVAPALGGRPQKKLKNLGYV
ncbi:hypothetical protein SGRA_0547 [Saprospira grandis str. Lewin]|uniref:Uncharacterized protein n=1 Tax=Saprospira grandis (strain Lewin) TaxID=984262 RepID=H6KZ02_SAPGL|nr:hypothetical protein SGRA_0547 [Saprospira grandis str. Lewin]